MAKTGKTIILILLAAVVIFGMKIVSYLTERIWYSSLGATYIWDTFFWSAVKYGAIFAITGFFLTWSMLRLAKKIIKSASEDGAVPIILNLLIPTAPFVAAVLLYLTGHFLNFDFLQAQHAATSPVTDPIFGKSFTYYQYFLPLKQELLNIAIIYTVVMLALLAFIYSISMLKFRNSSLTRSEAWALAHLTSLLAILTGLKAYDYRLAIDRLVYSPRGTVVGASFTDLHVSLPILKILSLVSVIAAVVFLLTPFLKKKHFFIYPLVGWLAFSILGGIVPEIYERFIVQANQFQKEEPYIKQNIAYTRDAFGLNNIKQQEFPVAPLNVSTIKNNQNIIDNIRLWDWRPLGDTLSNLQLLRPYYQFGDIDIDRYRIDGQYRLMMITARELNKEKIPNQTWQNLHLIYTHGYGFVSNTANETDNRGLPKLYAKDFPLNAVPELAVKHPQIYYGESTDDYIFTNTTEKEFDYPEGQSNAFSKYEGTGGISLSGLNKYLFALKLGSIRMVTSGYFTPESKLHIDRNINQRVAKLAPFLTFEPDGYLVASGGKLLWIIDGYTVSDRYPYSENYRFLQEDINYLRNSVKAVVDAYNGTVDFYITAPDDPLIQTYRNIFPKMFQDIADMPEDLKNHIRYPEEGFKLQATVLKKYHMTNPQTFFNSEDMWTWAKQKYHQELTTVDPYFVISRLPGEKDLEMLLMLPFTPKDRPNIISWLAARNDGDKYGQLVLLTFPKGKIVYGPQQIDANIDQDTEISKELSLWGQRGGGSEVIRGNLLVVPIENSLIYVEPLFLQAENNRFPELKRIFVSDGERLVMAQSLQEGIERLFGSGTTSPLPSSEGQPQDLLGDLIKTYRLSQKLYQDKNWVEYGAALAKIESLINAIEKQENMQTGNQEQANKE